MIVACCWDNLKLMFVLLQFDSTVPLQIENSLNLKSRLEAIKTYLSPALLDKIRIYLTLIPRLNYEISEEMTQVNVYLLLKFICCIYIYIVFGGHTYYIYINCNDISIYIIII